MDYDSLISVIQSALSSITCGYADVRVSSGTGTGISLAGADVESVSSGLTAGGSARVWHNGAWGFCSFNDLNSAARSINRAAELARSSPPDLSRSIARSAAIQKTFTTGYEIDVRQVSIDEKFALISEYNDILKKPHCVQTTRAAYRDVFSQSLFINTEGSVIRSERMYTGISLSSIAKDGSVIQPFHDSIAGYGGLELITGQHSAAEKVARTAVDLLKAESPAGGNYTVIADQKLAGVFIHEAFGHLSEADFIHQNEQMKKIMVPGSQFGPEQLTVFDDGSLKGLSGYIACDDEGITSKKTSLITGGVLTGRLHSRETAAAMGEEPTGNGRAISSMRQPIVRMTNTYIENGTSLRQELFDAADDGIYALDVIGGQTNLEMFTFTSAYGYEIKNGKPKKMFRDIVLSGNVFSTLKNIEMIADDRKMFGGLGGCGKEGQSPLPVSYGGPHILVRGVLIGGRR